MVNDRPLKMERANMTFKRQENNLMILKLLTCFLR